MNVPVILRRRRFQYGGAFSPLSLFASGEEGAWYEPSTTTAFLSTTDLTPCGYGDACGFLLDKSQGAGYSGSAFTGLGSELVSNPGGPFVNTTGYTTYRTASLSVVGGALRFSGGTLTFPNASIPISTEVGKTYLVEYSSTFVSGTDDNFFVSKSDAADTGVNAVAATGDRVAGDFIFSFTATAATTYIRIQANDAADVYDIAFISVRELPGNHATQGTEAARPILARVPEGGRRNILMYSEDLTNAAWNKSNVTATADTITENTATGIHQIGQLFSAASTVATYTVSATVSLASGTRQLLVTPIASTAAGNTAAAIFNLSTGTYVGAAAGRTGSFSKTPTITALGGGRYRVEVSAAATVANQDFGFNFRLADGTTETYTGDGSSAITIEEVQYELASSATAYQKVVDQYDITEAGVTSLDYLAFDGSDDGMATASIDFTATDKMSVFAGVEKESDAANGMFLELGNAAPQGSFTLAAPPGDLTGYFWRTRGSASISGVDTSTPAAPTKNTLTGIGDISGDNMELRVDGTSAGTLSVDQGTGNFGNYPLYLGARAGSSLFFDGKLFSLIVRGAASTAGEISDTESYVANLSGVSL